LVFNIDELQLQIQLLHLGCHWLLLLTVTGRKSKDSAITPETTQTYSHTPLPAWRTAEQRVPSTQNFVGVGVDVTQKHKLGLRQGVFD